MKKIRAIVIGASGGGLNALSFILEKLPPDFSLPILIVQHIHPESDSSWINYINMRSEIYVKEAENNEKIEEGHVYIAPPNYHLLVENDYTVVLSKDEKVNFSRPSIDVLMESASDIYGKDLTGIILSGTNSDGTLGLKRIKQNGGISIVQDPSEAEYNEMPASAIRQSKIDYILPLSGIVELLKNNYKGQ